MVKTDLRKLFPRRVRRCKETGDSGTQSFWRCPQVSDYPVILSLENHCSVEQQDTMAQHLKSILGEKLVTSTMDGRIPVQLPSPEVGQTSIAPFIGYEDFCNHF